MDKFFPFYIYTILLDDKKHNKCDGLDLNPSAQCGNNDVQLFRLICKYNLIISLKYYIYHSIK